MDTDELEPKRPVLEPLDLEKVSVEDLNEYIVRLEAEIARARAEIAAKQSYRGDAEALFKT